MRSIGSVLIAVGILTGAVVSAAPAGAEPTGVPGVVVSTRDGNVDWPSIVARGARFVVAKATEGTGYTNPHFARIAADARRHGLMRGAYHFALPDRSGGTAQADYLVDNGGGWTADGTTLPPAVDLEYNPYGPTCYGLSAPAMVRWIGDFVDRVHARTGRWPTIYTTTTWWSQCTGNLRGFSAKSPLWITRSGPGQITLPHDWRSYLFSSELSRPDGVLFHGTLEQLRRFASSGG